MAAWNAHDLDAIMALYAPGVVFQTPTIIDTLGIADGTVHGAERLREHFGRGLERLADLRFEPRGRLRRRQLAGDDLPLGRRHARSASCTSTTRTG